MQVVDFDFREQLTTQYIFVFSAIENAAVQSILSRSLIQPRFVIPASTPPPRLSTTGQTGQSPSHNIRLLSHAQQQEWSTSSPSAPILRTSPSSPPSKPATSRTSPKTTFSNTTSTTPSPGLNSPSSPSSAPPSRRNTPKSSATCLPRWKKIPPTASSTVTSPV